MSKLDEKVQALIAENEELKRDKQRLERMLVSSKKKVAFLSNLNSVYAKMIETQNSRK